MKRLSRCVLVGLLVSTMAVDFAAARRLFGGRCSRARCVRVCTPIRAEACCVESCEVHVTALPIAQSSSPPCVAEVPITAAKESCNPCDTVAQPNVEYPSSGHRDTLGGTPEFPEIPPEETYELFEEPKPSLETPEEDTEESLAPAESPASQPILPVEQLAVPEREKPSASESASPRVEPPSVPLPTTRQPSEDVVGDRYSEESLLVPPTRFEPISPEATTPTAESADELSDLFDEPAPREAENNLEEDSQPEPAETATDTNPNTDDLFGPDEPMETQEPVEQDVPTTSEVSESKNIESEPVEPSPGPDQTEPEQTEPEQSEPEELEPKDSEPPKKFEPYDPFGDAPPELDSELSALVEPGGLHSTATRTWSDIRAAHQFDAKLVRVTSKQVVLNRATGSELSVSLRHLATEDLRFVQRQISALRIARTRAEAAKLLAADWSK